MCSVTCSVMVYLVFLDGQSVGLCHQRFLDFSDLLQGPSRAHAAIPNKSRVMELRWRVRK